MRLERVHVTPRLFGDEQMDRFAASNQEAHDAVPVQSLVWLRGVVADGAGGALPPIRWEGLPPAAALVVRVVPHADRAASAPFTANLNFKMTRSGVAIYEPAGLTANATYDVLVWILGGG